MAGAEKQDGKEKRGIFKAFWDFVVLFSGVSTSSNLSRTQGKGVRGKGLFLVREPGVRERGAKPPEPPAGR